MIYGLTIALPARHINHAITLGSSKFGCSYFQTYKTARSTGTKVTVPIGNDAHTLIIQVSTLGKMRSIYVIHTEQGQPYTSNGIGSLFKLECARVGN